MVGVGGGGWLGLVVVVYHVTIIANGHGVLKKVSPFGNRMRSTHCREFLYMKLCSPAYYARTTQFLVLVFGNVLCLTPSSLGGGGGGVVLVCFLRLGFFRCFCLCGGGGGGESCTRSVSSVWVSQTTYI